MVIAAVGDRCIRRAAGGPEDATAGKGELMRWQYVVQPHRARLRAEVAGDLVRVAGMRNALCGVFGGFSGPPALTGVGYCSTRG